TANRPDQIAERRNPQHARQTTMDDLDRVGIEREIEPERLISDETLERNLTEAGPGGPHCRGVARHEQRTERNIDENRARPEPGRKTKHAGTPSWLRRREHRCENGRNGSAREGHVARGSILTDSDARQIIKMKARAADQPPG